jgi:hypothetical protein
LPIPYTPLPGQLQSRSPGGHLALAQAFGNLLSQGVHPVGPNSHANILGYGIIATMFLDTYRGAAT